MKNNYYYNKKLKGLARGLRKDSTKAEIKLWQDLLRAKTLRGYPFLRQRPVGKYIVDFMSKDLKLIIEVDGYSHNFKFDEDPNKDHYLNELGFSVIRFSDEEVRNDFNNVIRTLEHFIDQFEESSSP